MQIDSLANQVGEHAVNNEELGRQLGAMIVQIRALQSQVSAEGAVLALPALRQGLSVLDQMAGKLFSEWRTASGKFLLPDLPLGEALAELVEETAETLGLSSRTVFTGEEQPLSLYKARLLYSIVGEILAQVPEHAGARRLRFSLEYRPTELVLLIEDDGVPDNGKPARTALSEESPLPFLREPPAEESPLPFLRDAGANEGNTLQSEPAAPDLGKFISYLGGTLLSNSSVEQGTQIQLRIPYDSCKSEELPKEAGSNAATVPLKTGLHTTVLIVAGQAVSRAGLRRLLESYEDLEVIGEAGDSVQAASEATELLPRMILIDVQSFHDQSLETLHQIRQLNTEMPILLLSDQEDEALLYAALRAGVNGFVLKDVAPDELAQAVRAIGRGEVLIQPQLAAHLLTRFGEQEHSKGVGRGQESLTAREQEVLLLLARGLRNKEMAARLFVSERTVNFHLANIYAKLHVSGRTEALSKALGQGLIKA
jgi:DNA-binding NarL/FixJ family response regulator